MTEETKLCSTCSETKSVFDFYKSNQRAGARTKTAGFIQSRCKSCQARDRDFYKKRNQAFVQKEKSRSGCVECGYNKNPVALDYHHVNENDKRFSLASVKAAGCSIQDLIDEIAKCIVLCANCHRIKHYGEKFDSTNTYRT